MLGSPELLNRSEISVSMAMLAITCQPEVETHSDLKVVNQSMCVYIPHMISGLSEIEQKKDRCYIAADTER